MSEIITIIGRIPPPIGGVSVFCQRRFSFLKESGVDVSFLDFGEKDFLLNYMLSNKGVFEVNTLNIFVVLLLFITRRVHRAEFVDHNASRHYSGFKKKILLFMLKRSRSIKIVNKRLADFYPDSFNIKLISPFIPPKDSGNISIDTVYPADLKDFMSEGRIVINTAWKVIPHGLTDLYGITTSLELLQRNKDIKLLLVIGLYDKNVFTDSNFNLINQYINEKRLYLLKGQYEVWPLFKYRPICLRLTPTDGDSVTVREALHFGAPVIASDSIIRPEGCHLYQYGNIDSLMSTLDKLL